MNVAARRLLGAAGEAGEHDAEALFGVGLQGLLVLTRRESAGLLRLPSGLSVWLRARLQARDGSISPARVSVAVAIEPRAPDAIPDASDIETEPMQTPATLDAQHRALIDQTLAACDGNVSRAARTLGVSRGLLYRHLRQHRSET